MDCTRTGTTARQRLARRLRTLALALLVSILAAPQLTCARVAQALDGSLVIERSRGGAARYDAYLVFCADVDAAGVATHLSWPDDETRELVLPYLDAQGYPAWLAERHPGDGQHDLAQNAAEYASEMIGASRIAVATGRDGEGASERQGSGRDASSKDTADERPTATRREVATYGSSFATGLARTLAASDLAPRATTAVNETLTGPQGLWLIVADEQGEAAVDDADTAPLWVPLGSADLRIYEKSSLPTIAKQVREDSTGEWGRVADAQMGQPVDFRILATLPDNLEAFPSYHFAVTDHLGDHLALDTEGKALSEAVEVLLNDQPVPLDGQLAEVTLQDGCLVVSFPDLRSAAWERFGPSSGASVSIGYRARLTEGCAIGEPGNLQEVSLTYTSSPVTLREASSPVVETKVYTYAIRLAKVDDQDQRALNGASFALRSLPGTGEQDSKARYVQADGSLAAEPHGFVTADDGTVEVRGLDEGSYALQELEAPSGYQALDGELGISLTTQLDDQDLALAELALSSESKAVQVERVDAGSGLATLRVSNHRRPVNPGGTTPGIERLPQTGVGPLAELSLAFGALLLAIALRQRRRKERRP